MKIFKLKRAVALSLALLIVTTACFTGSLLSASAEKQAIMSDSFDDYTATKDISDYWETVPASNDVTPSQISGQPSVVAGEGVDGSFALKIPNIAEYSAIRKTITTPKEDVTSKGVLNSFSFYAKFPNGFYDSHPGFMLYSNNGDYLNVDFGVKSDFTLDFRPWKNGDSLTLTTVSQNIGAVNSTDNTKPDYDLWVKYEFVYDYKFSENGNSVDIHLNLSNRYTQIQDYAVYRLTGISESFCVGFTSPASNSPSNYVDNVEYNVTSYESVAAQYRSKYAALLANDNPTEADISAYNAASEEFSTLPSGAKELLTDVKLKLDGIEDKIVSSISSIKLLSYDEQYHNLAWEYTRVNSLEDESAVNGTGIVSNAKYTDEDGTAIYTSAVASKYKSPIVSVPKDSAWPVKTLTSFETSFKLENGGWDTYAAIYTLVLDDVNGGMPYYLAIQFDTSNGFYARPMSNLTTVNQHYIHGDKTFDTAGWIKLKVEYDYTDYPKKLNFKYTFTDENGYTVSADTYVIFENGAVTVDNDHFKIGIGTLYGNKANTQFKNLSANFEYNERDTIAQFIKKYAGILSLTSYSGEYETDINNMAEEFYTNTAYVRSQIYDSGKLNSLIELLKTTELYNEAQTFANKYSSILTAERVNLSDSDAINTAIAEYGGLSTLSRLLLLNEKARLDELYADLAIMRNDDDYSSYNLNFEDGVNPFAEVTEPTEYAYNQIVTDPTNPDNKVLCLGGKDDAYTIKYWPTLGAVKEISFRMKTDSHLFTHSNIFLGYEDEDNYYAAAYEFAYGMNISFSKACVDGIRTGGQTNGIAIDAKQWIQFTLTYSDSSVLVSATDEDKNTTTWSCRYARGGAFGFGYISSGGFAGRNMYIDDIVINFYDFPGDFDVNDSLSKIDVYYTGNTFLNPDDSVSLNGNKLWVSTADDVLIEKVPDSAKTDLENTASKVNVVEQSNYGTDGKNYSTLADTAEHYFDESQAVGTTAIQRALHSMAFQIPKTLEKGIYSVKLSPKLEGLEPVVIYLNRPDISFITGDEGNIATRGGTMRIVGSNLVPTGNADDVTVRLINKSTGENYNLPVSSVYENDGYALSLNVPSDLVLGDYEVYVHNGYGDNTCWSDACSITISVSPKESWNLDSAHWFDVTDFGAKGDGKTNDTPAIINALHAASVDGGTVYFPQGMYSVCSTLAIPERVSVAGAGVGNTVISYSAHRWQYGEVPVLISIIGNAELRDISVAATRTDGIIVLPSVNTRYGVYTPDENNAGNYIEENYRDNVYIKNVHIRAIPEAGLLSAGGGYGRPINGTDRMEVLSYINAEAKKTKFNFRSGLTNLQIDNFEFQQSSLNGGSTGDAVMRVVANQVQIRNSNWGGYSLVSSGYGALIEDNDMLAAALNPSGNGFYCARNYLHDSTGNNRELLTTDGEALHKNIYCQFIGARSDMMQECFGTDELDDTLYLLTGIGKTNYNYYKGYNIVVTSGQGVGQLRVITESKTVTVTQNGKRVLRTCIRVATPFSVAPNRRSTVSISEPRDSFFFINNDFYNGAASGSYGMMINAVWDGNTFGKHEGQYFFSNTSPMWYITLKNQLHFDPSYIHGESDQSPGSWGNGVTNRNYRSMLNIQTAESPFGCIGFTLRDCKFNGYGYSITQGQSTESITGFIMEHCTFNERDDNPIIFTTVANGCGSLLFRDNTFNTDGDFDKAENPAPYSAVNKEGYQIIMIVNSEYSADRIVKGDVNLDGAVTLKDCTMIRMYIIGRIELSEKQLERADTNSDGKVNLKDVSVIRYWILTDFTDMDLEEVAPPPEGGLTTDNSSGWIDADF